VLGLLDLFVFR